MTPGADQGVLLDYMLMLLLQTSTRLKDLEATTYYTHVIPAQSALYKALEDVYQGYLYTAAQNKDHNMGPKGIHRGKALLDHVVEAEEDLKEKTGLAPPHGSGKGSAQQVGDI